MQEAQNIVDTLLGEYQALGGITFEWTPACDSSTAGLKLAKMVDKAIHSDTISQRGWDRVMAALTGIVKMQADLQHTVLQDTVVDVFGTYRTPPLCPGVAQDSFWKSSSSRFKDYRQGLPSWLQVMLNSLSEL